MSSKHPGDYFYSIEFRNINSLAFELYRPERYITHEEAQKAFSRFISEHKQFDVRLLKCIEDPATPQHMRGRGKHLVMEVLEYREGRSV